MTTLSPESLSAFLDGELSAEEELDLQGRLLKDPTLRAELDALREVVAAVRARGVERAPLHFHAGVMQAVDSEPVNSLRGVRSWLRRPFGIPAEGLALAAVALWVLFGALDASRPGSSAWTQEEPRSGGSDKAEVRGAFPAVGTLPEALALATDEPEFVEELLAGAQGLGVRVLDEHGRPVTDAGLWNHRTVWVEVPVERFDELREELRRHGSLQQGPLVVVGGTPLIRLEVQLYPAKLRP